MTTLQELTLKQVFEIRDALTILDRYGFASKSLKQEVQQWIADFRVGVTPEEKAWAKKHLTYEELNDGF